VEFKKRNISYKRQGKSIVDPVVQMSYIKGLTHSEKKITPFSYKLKENNQFPLKVSKLEILQVNIGYMCNQICEHCHIDAGPDRKEIMSKEIMIKCLDIVRISEINIVDITGGAPEMNPEFRWFIKQLKKLGVNDIIIRSNLTIVLANKKYNYLPDFFKENKLHIVSSLPCYTKENTDKQRGNGVFEASIKVLKKLNSLGYGKDDDLKLDLVYNPGGAFLPGDQSSLELAYKKQLNDNYSLVFNNLFTMTNMPISRFLDCLVSSNQFTQYMNTLVNAFNPLTLRGLMCKNTISVRWDGELFDCDFNQIFDLPLNCDVRHVNDFDLELLSKRDIATSQHCYGCTAGAGSSCQGATC